MNAVVAALERAAGPLPVLLALAAAALLLAAPRRVASGQPEAPISIARRIAPLIAFAALVPLAGAVAFAPLVAPAWAALALALVVLLLTRDPSERLESECALKLAWVMGGSLALSLAGEWLLTLATGTSITSEQWGVLAIGLEPRFVWGTALALSLLVGLVLLGGAPFHFWSADLFQGASSWLAPFAVASLQVCGAAWLAHRMAGIEAYPAAAELAGGLLRIAAAIALIAGAGTLMAQRRPERRVGTLASLNGALALTMIAAAHGREIPPEVLAAWAAHLVLGLTGASLLARFTPVWWPPGTPPAPLFRRHPAAAIAGLYALFSLAGAPGTPGAVVWLATARSLAHAGQSWLLVALAAAWLAAFGAAAHTARAAFATPRGAIEPRLAVPWQTRMVLVSVALGLLLVAIAGWSKS